MKVYKSRQPYIDLPHLDILTWMFDSDWCLAKPDTKIHVEAADPTNHITKAETGNLLRQVAYVLRHQYGIGAMGPGRDVVLAISSGSAFLPVFVYSVWGAGGIFSGASTGFKTAELVRQIEDSEAGLLVCSAEYLSLTVEAAKQCGISKDMILVLDGATPKQWRLLSKADNSDILQCGGGKMLEWPRITDPTNLKRTPVCLLYSSGTTGLPKGVLISHWGLVSNNIVTMAVARRYQARFQREGRIFSFNTVAHLPMAHIAGVDMYATNPFYMGGTTYWMKRYDFDSFIEYHRLYRPDFQFSVPPIWLQIAKSRKITDHFDGLQVATTGAAPLGYEVAKALRRLGKGKCLVTQTYGMTEGTGSVCSLDYHIRDETWSVGDLCPNTTLRILDENDQDVEDPSQQAGEICIGGPILCQGYHNNPTANQTSFIDGFYRTGDIGLYKNGLVYVVDRKKELIKYKGLQVAPAELEALLVSHPRIADAAVIGVEDRVQQTEVPRAYIVRRQWEDGSGEKSPLSAEEVADFVKENAASYKQLRGGIVFLGEIPKSMSGKMLKKELRLRDSEALPSRL